MTRGLVKRFAVDLPSGRLAAATVAVALAGSLAGCDDGRPSTTPPPEAGVLRFDAAMLARDAGLSDDAGDPPDADSIPTMDAGTPRLDAGSDAGPPLACSRGAAGAP